MKRNIIGVLFAAGVGLAVASPAEGADQKTDQIADKSPRAALSGNNGPESYPVWVLPAVLLVAGFAAGYGVRSLVSLRRRASALRSRYGSLTEQTPTGRVPPSDRLQLEVSDNAQLSLRLVPRDDVGDLQSPRRPSRDGT